MAQAVISLPTMWETKFATKDIITFNFYIIIINSVICIFQLLQLHLYGIIITGPYIYYDNQILSSSSIFDRTESPD